MKELAHLTKKELYDLMDKYYNSKKTPVKDLKKEYNIKSSKALHTLFPPMQMGTICRFCHVNLVKEFNSRYDSIPDQMPKCPKCGHKGEKSTTCTCIHCMKKHEITEKKQISEKEFIYNTLKGFLGDPVDFNSLTFEEKVYLGAFLRAGISEDYNYVYPSRTFITPFTPTEKNTFRIIRHLEDKRIILPHPDSALSSFTKISIEEEDFYYYIDKVKWVVNVYNRDKNKIDLIDSIIMPTFDVNYEEAYKLWLDISLQEALEYFVYSISIAFNIDYTIGEKTESILRDLLNDYSVSQIYSIIYRITNNALRYKVEQQISAQHAANTISGNMQSFAERAKLLGWDLQKYQRVKECPESALSKFFFERILRIGSAGFYEKPRVLSPPQ